MASIHNKKANNEHSTSKHVPALREATPKAHTSSIATPVVVSQISTGCEFSEAAGCRARHIIGIM